MLMLLAVAYLTLLERKVMSYTQSRVGPNKILFVGLLQPIVDGVKLFLKSHMVIVSVLPAILSLVVPLGLLCVLDLNHEYMLLLYLSVLSLSVWPLIMASWSSYSSYPVLATIRIVAQSVSYEVVLYLILVPFVVCSSSWSGYSECFWVMCLMLLVGIISVIVGLSEMHRIPFDFAEGESELVSGYNTEFSSISFTLLFLAEYLSMLIMSVLLSLILLSGWYMSPLAMFVILMVRFVYVRLRYDQLMWLLWKKLLPVMLGCLMVVYTLYLVL